MKHLLILAFLVPAFGADPLPSAETILNHYVEATGGQAAYDRVKTEIVKGKLELPSVGLKGEMIRYSAAPDNYYVSADLAGIGKMESGVAHGVAWDLSVLQGARIKTGEEKSQAVLEAELVGAHDWRKLGYKAQTAGMETIDGEDCYKVILTPPEGKPITVYFQKKSGLAVKTTAIAASPMGDIPLEAVMSDYKTVDGLTYAAKTTETVVGQTILYTIDSIQYNVDIPASRFDLPDEVKALADKAGK